MPIISSSLDNCGSSENNSTLNTNVGKHCLSKIRQFLLSMGLTSTLCALDMEIGNEKMNEILSNQFDPNRDNDLICCVLESDNLNRSRTSDTSSSFRSQDGALKELSEDVIVTSAWCRWDVDSNIPLHHGNILCVDIDNSSDEQVISVSGGLDRTVVKSDVLSSVILWRSAELPGPVLSIAIEPDTSLNSRRLILATTMACTCALLDSASGEIVAEFKDHDKYVNRCSWSYDAQYFATCSHDYSICIYSRSYPDSIEFKLLRNILLSSVVECIVFSPVSLHAIAFVRDNHNLYLFSFESNVDEGTIVKTNSINMNENGDSHISFTALDVAFSPDGLYVAIATDASCVLIYPVAESLQLRRLTSVINDRLSNPRCCFGSSSRYVYCTSASHEIFCWDIATSRVIAMLKGHTSNIKSVAYSQKKNILMSTGLDKSLRVWH